MEDTLEVMEHTYRRFFATGMVLLLLAFAMLIFRPLGRTASPLVGVLLFLVAFIPLELARRVARRMALVAFRGDRKA